ncbi:hypothetical protein [Winogradskya consettensis]|uniref:hypothetical protein n=1 Tax=Winogradskya consettensis TaxID=113560 RepID=UPI001BB425CA|nr:hypothetical protein [Actinoplanes consettensis]
MRIRAVVVGVTAVAALALTGCGTDAGGGGAVAGDKAAVAKDDGVDVANAPISADELCAYLKKELPGVRKQGSEIGAMAQLTMGIADLYGDHLDQLDGDVLDAQAVQTCPETRDELVKAAGVKSLGDL